MRRELIWLTRALAITVFVSPSSGKYYGHLKTLSNDEPLADHHLPCLVTLRKRENHYCLQARFVRRDGGERSS
jgi:hypothetical protein